MVIEIKKNNIMNATTARNIKRVSGNMSLKFLKTIGGRGLNIAVMNFGELDLVKLQGVCALEEHKVPVYKQAMDMQMGRIPQQVTYTQKILRVRELSPAEVNNARDIHLFSFTGRFVQ